MPHTMKFSLITH